jgi:hypothetical protein
MSVTRISAANKQILRRRHGATAAVLAAVLVGCVQSPTGPSVSVMPAPGKPFEVFVGEVQACRNYAAQSVGYSAEQAAAHSLAESEVVSTLVGTAAAALIGGHRAAGSGAAAGLIIGTEVGVPAAAASAYSAQQRYDIAYSQCMYAKGNLLPGQALPPSPTPPPPPPPR